MVRPSRHGRCPARAQCPATNEGLRGLLDKHAPMTPRRVLAGRSAPWYASVSEDLRSAKRRRSERRWLRQASLQIHSAAKRTVARIVHRAKSDYFSSDIAQSTSCKQLFNVCDKLRGCRPDSPPPATFPLCELPDVFCEYFVRKVKMIRDELDSRTPLLNSPTDDSSTDSSICAFQPVSIECVRKMILKSPLKTCSLDQFPHRSLLNV